MMKRQAAGTKAIATKAITTQTVAHTWLKLDADNHTDPVVALAVSTDGRTVVSAGECTLRVWDVATRKLRRQILGHTNPRVEGGSADGTISCMALSPDGRWVVTLKNAKRIEVFNVETGNLVTAFEHTANPGSVVFSPDGRWLALGITRRHGPIHRRGSVEVLATRRLTAAGFDKAPKPDAVHAVAETRMVDEVMHLVVTPRWIPAPVDQLTWSQTPARSRSRTAGRRGQAAGYGLVVAVHSLSDSAQSQLKWLAFRPRQGIASIHAVEPDRPIDAATLAVSAQGVAVATEFDGYVDASERPLGRLIALDHQGRQIGEVLLEQAAVATAFSPDGKALAVGLDLAATGEGQHIALTHMLAFGPAGFEPRSTYYGHDLPVRAVAWLGPDRVLSSGGDNSAIHAWSPRTRVGLQQAALRGFGQDMLDPGIDELGQLRFGTVPQRLRPPNHATRQQRFDLRELRLYTVSPSEPDSGEAENTRWVLGGHGQQVLQIYHRPDTEGWEPQLFRPGHLTLFVGADDSWTLWTRSGFYATNSPQKSRFGYCVDRGPRREALFLPADRFAVFDREDIVRAVVEHGSEDRARARGVEIPVVDVALILPPVVEIERFTVAADRREVRLSFSVEPLHAAQPTTRIWILRNGRYVWFEADAKALRRRRWSVPVRLNPGRNEFMIHAESATAKSVPCALEIEGPAAAAAKVQLEAGKGKLFLLSVGVSDFQVAGTEQAGATKPLSFPHRDATAIYNALAGSRKSARFDPRMALRNAAFESVEAALLVQAQATKAAILAQVRRFADAIVERDRKAGAERDVLLVFLSGHGTRFSNEPELYFWNWDLVPTGKDMERTGLSLVEFAEIATAVPAEVVLVIDACHSGMAGNNMMRGLDPEELARRICAIHERGLYVINAARSEQLSWEHGALRHGVFTSALLEALRDRRYASGPERSVNMLSLVAAVQDLVGRISKRVGIKAPQTPVCRLYGDLLPLTIYRSPRTRQVGNRKGNRLRGKTPSANVPPPPGNSNNERKTTMATAKKVATKKAAAKKAAAKKAAGKKAPAKKAAAKKAATKKPSAKKTAKKTTAARKTSVKGVKSPSKALGAASKPGADVMR
jgi:WD40 repeat protein/uncharacterized caspase-like protein